MDYFLISVSNRQNLELCIKYAMAGFTNSINGLWTFTEIREGDFISFLYGARVFNLYQVKKKVAIEGAGKLGPWPSVTFRMSGRTYYFPFRIFLKPIREFNEPMVRQEFSYVAENLLLRGGYRRTHFQADQITLHAVSQMGTLYKQDVEELHGKYKLFTPRVVWKRELVNPPKVFYFHEFILQPIIRKNLSIVKNLKRVFNILGWRNLNPEMFEILGEKALPEGHIDILIKESRPVGKARKIIVEVKSGKATSLHVKQLKGYLSEIGDECLGGILIAKSIPQKVVKEAESENIKCLRYSFNHIDDTKTYPIDYLETNFNLDKIYGS